VDTASPPAPAPKKRSRLWPKLLVGFLGLLGILAIVIASQPTDYMVYRTALIDAPPDRVVKHVGDFKNWDAWSPWAKRDPNMTQQISDPSGGVGATYSWSGNSDVGKGKMTIVGIKENAEVNIKLEFLEPFPSEADTAFAVRNERGKSVVTWRMQGKHDFISKAFCLVMDMDAMIGGDFEQGLAKLKEVVETK
jgi:hypothetical protein